MKVKVIVFAVAACLGWLILAHLRATSRLNDLNEQAREAFEDGDYCTSYQKFERLAPDRRSANRMLGIFYAGGFCVPQDIARAKAYFAPYYGTPKEMGRSLFYQALEVAASDELKGQPMRTKEMTALFSEAKSLGYRPTAEDLKRSRYDSYLKPEFFNWESAQTK